MGPTASDSHGGSGPNEVRRELRGVQLINVQPGWLIGDHYVTGVASGKFWKREFHRKRMGKKNILEIIGFTEIMPGYVLFVHHGPF